MDFKNKIKQELINEDIHLSLTNEQRESIADLTDYQLRLYIVSQQRELLYFFAKSWNENQTTAGTTINSDDIKDCIEKYNTKNKRWLLV